MRILILLFISFFSFSQEEQYRSEFAWCNLKDEKSIDDAKNIASKYLTNWWKPKTSLDDGISKVFTSMKKDYD